MARGVAPAEIETTDRSAWMQRAAYVLEKLPEPKTQKFILFAQGRTGSTLLGELLDAHPRLRFDHEILWRPVSRPLAFAEGLRNRCRVSAYGFHVKIYQLTETQHVADPGEWLRTALDAGWKFVHLRRANLVRHTLSGQILRQLDVSHFRAGDGKERPSLAIDPDDLFAAVRRRERMGESEDRALEGIPHIRIGYETDLVDSSAWNATAGRVFDHLGLEPASVGTSLRAINNAPVSDLVGNFEAIVERFESTPYYDMLFD